MNRLANLQFLGPTFILFGVGTADAAARGLSHVPTSETLWYLHLEIFGIFQKSHYLLNEPLYLPYSQFFLIALPLFAIATYGFFAKRAFLLALASNLSFVYTAFLVYIGMVGQSHPLEASLTSIAVSAGPSIYLPLALVGASLISFSITHYQYLFGIFHLRPMPGV